MRVWIRYIAKYVKKNYHRIVDIYKDDIKKSSTEIVRSIMINIKNEYIEKCKPTPLALMAIEHFIEFYESRIEKLIEQKINELIGGKK